MGKTSAGQPTGGKECARGCSIRAAVVRVSSVKMAATRSSSRSAVVARARAWATSYLFFTAAVLSFFRNLAASTAWRSSSVAIGGGGVAHKEAVRLTGDVAEGERVAGP
jgi:hypothetical protein